jgi:hypothetical protein
MKMNQFNFFRIILEISNNNIKFSFSQYLKKYRISHEHAGFSDSRVPNNQKFQVEITILFLYYYS